MAALAGYLCNLYITSNPSVSFTNVALTDSGDHKTFSIPTASERYWDKSQVFTVQTAPDGSTWTTVTTGFTIQYVGGKVIFTNVVTGATPSCRVSGYYLPYSFLGDAKEVDITPMMNVLDASAFTNPPSLWKTKVAEQAGGTVAVKKWWIDQTFSNYLNNAMLVLIAYSGANANQRYECFAKLKQDNSKFAIAALATEDLQFDVDGQIYFIPS